MQDVSIFIDNHQVDIGDLSIQFELINPMFSENNFNTEYSFEFKLPFTPRNKKALRYSNRFDVPKKWEYSCKVIISGFQLFDVFVRASLSDDGYFALTAVSRGIHFVQKAELKNLKELPMKQIDIWQDGDTVDTKLGNWKEHVEQVMLSDLPTEGTHKFPMIRTAGYGGDFNDNNLAMAANNHMVNSFGEGEFLDSWAVETGDKRNPTDNCWPFTVSPCPRILYLVQVICDYYGIKKLDGDLWSNLELQQMIVFSGVVLDQVFKSNSSVTSTEWVLHGFFIEPVTTTTVYNWEINCYGSGFNLADFVPDVKVLTLFKTLHELFGCWFRLEDGRLIARTSKEILAKPSKDYSKWVVNTGVPEQQEDFYYALYYEKADDNSQRKVLVPYWGISFPSGLDVLNDDSEKGINENPEQVNTEITLTHFPMKSTFFVTGGIYADRDSWLTGTDETKLAYGEYTPRFVFPYGISSLGDSTTKARQDMWNVGCYRGVYDTIQVHPVDDEMVTDYYSMPWPYSFDQPLWDYRSINPPLNHNFGKSLYLTANKGSYEEYLRNELNKVGNSDTVSNDMNLPLHEFIELQKFEDIKHHIKDRRGDYVGFLEKISGEITNRGLGLITCDYRVPKNVLSQGEFNGDFSNDFNG